MYPRTCIRSAAAPEMIVVAVPQNTNLKTKKSERVRVLITRSTEPVGAKPSSLRSTKHLAESNGSVQQPAETAIQAMFNAVKIPIFVPSESIFHRFTILSLHANEADSVYAFDDAYDVVPPWLRAKPPAHLSGGPFL